jgi:hypothetical protein
LPPAFMLVSCSASSTLKMEAICSSKMSVGFQQTTRHYVPEDNIHLVKSVLIFSYILLFLSQYKAYFWPIFCPIFGKTCSWNSSGRVQGETTILSLSSTRMSLTGLLWLKGPAQNWFFLPVYPSWNCLRISEWKEACSEHITIVMPRWWACHFTGSQSSLAFLSVQ